MFVVTKSARCASHDAISLRLYSDFEADYDIVQGTEANWQKIQLRWAPDDTDPGERGQRHPTTRVGAHTAP